MPLAEAAHEKEGRCGPHMEYVFKPIAHIRTDFEEKFGIPRQAGLSESSEGLIVFEPEYRDGSALRGLSGYSHIWLIWGFSRSECGSAQWSPTVRPPKLGGNERVGVFASRSPNRPNSVGLSAVRVIEVCEAGPESPYIKVAGADILNGTPIFDIKPYVPYADSIPDASGGFARGCGCGELEVEIPQRLAAKIPSDKARALTEVLRLDPRPGYHDDPERSYGLKFAGLDIKFKVAGGRLCVEAVEGPPKPVRSGGPERRRSL